MWDTSPILYVSYFFKIKFSIIKQDTDTWNIKLISLVITIKKKCIYMESLEKTMPMFVCLTGYLVVLAFPSKFINVDFKAGIFICES